MERSLVSVAASTGRPSIVIFDRGLFDAAGYMTRKDWLRVLDEVKNTQGSLPLRVDSLSYLCCSFCSTSVTWA